MRAAVLAEQRSVASGDVFGLGESKPPCRAIDPVSRPFDFEKRADRSLVKCDRAQALRIEVFGPIFFISKN